MTEDELRALIEAHPVEGDPDATRAAFEALAAAAGQPDLGGLTVSENEGGDTRYLVIQPESATGAPIVHLHGGGYVFGSPDSHRAFGAELARATGRAVVLPGYPLAPEAPWPAQRDAAMAFLAALGPPFVLSGDSAGGHLALSCVLGGAKPEALILFSPNVSRAYGRSRTRGAPDDAMVDHAADDRLARFVFGRVRASDMDQTLVDRDLSGLPPTLIDVGAQEVLLDDALALVGAAARAGAPVALEVRPGFHLVQLFAADFPPGRASLARAGAWLAALSARERLR